MVKLTHTKLSVIDCFDYSESIHPRPRPHQDRPPPSSNRLGQDRFRILGDALSAVLWPPPHL